MLRKVIWISFIIFIAANTGNASETHTYWFPIIHRARPSIGNGVAHDFVGENPAYLAPLVAAMHDAGIRSVRVPLRWTLIEPQKGRFTWAKTDRAVNLLAQNGFDIIGVLTWVPTWANGQSDANTPASHYPEAYPPDKVSDFTSFATAVAARYQGKIDSYEIFNEPNSNQFWRPTANINQYIPFLCDGYKAIKRADPSAAVGMGGLVGNGVYYVRSEQDLTNFLPALYEQDAKDCFDMVVLHPYVHPIEQGLDGLQEFLDAARAEMVANDDGQKQIWLTEMGWSTAPNAWDKPTVSEAQIADWITKLYRDLKGVERIYWYNLRDIGVQPNNVEHHFGLLNNDLTPKPAFNAYKQVANP